MFEKVALAVKHTTCDAHYLPIWVPRLSWPIRPMILMSLGSG